MQAVATTHLIATLTRIREAVALHRAPAESSDGPSLPIKLSGDGGFSD